MCVIAARKLKLKNSNKENWFLYKVRDRNYSPVYELDVEKKNGIETLFLTDQATAWSEGINSEGLMIVSAALDNHSDLDDNGQSSGDKPATGGQIEKTETLRKAMSADSIEKAEKILVDNRFIGTSFISDGDDLIILEIYVNDEAYQREIEKHDKKELEKMQIVDQVYKVMEGITKKDYDVASHKVKKDKLAVRTNHGRLLDDAGYQSDDEDTSGWTSSMLRYKHSYNALNKLPDDSHPFDVLTSLKNLTNVEKKGGNNPIRPKLKKDKNGSMPYYSSTIVMLTPTGTLFAIPLDSEIDNKSKLNLKSERKVDFVLLPKNLPLFENLVTSFKSFNIKNKNYFKK